MKLRVGTVPYLVARPLSWGLAAQGGVALTVGTPAELARGLREERLDVALASSILSLGDDPLPLWSGGPVIAARRHIRSVLLFLRPGSCGPHQVRRLVTDPDSRTGRALAEIVLRDRFGADFVAEPFPRGQDPFRSGADAVQLIGDPALEALVDRPDWIPVDLGETWNELTRLPFVFAGWIGRRRFNPADAAEVLLSAMEKGLEARSALLREGATLGQDEAFLRRYLFEDLSYRLPAHEVRASLDEFARRLAAGGARVGAGRRAEAPHEFGNCP